MLKFIVDPFATPLVIKVSHVKSEKSFTVSPFFTPPTCTVIVEFIPLTPGAVTVTDDGTSGAAFMVKFISLIFVSYLPTESFILSRILYNAPGVKPVSVDWLDDCPRTFVRKI
jgi:hypothetical protein